MIIRDYREITRKSEAPDHKSEEKGKVSDYLAGFDRFHLGERSRQTLTEYFRYLSRKDKIKKMVPYNFMVHCDDNASIKEFMEALSEAVHTIWNTAGNMVTISEEEFLSKPQTAISSMKGSSVFVMTDCLSSEEFSPEYPRAKAEEIKRERNAAWKQFMQACENTPETCKIIAASDHILKERFRNSEQFYDGIFRNHIYIGETPSEEIFASMLEELANAGISCSEEFKSELEKYIQVVYPKADLKNKQFINDLTERILTAFYGRAQNIDELTPDYIPAYQVEKNYEEVLKEMDDLVGLRKVKETFLEIPYMLQESSKDVAPSLHMAFIGNPGTGKTTVAHLAADLLYSMGVIKRNKVVAVSALDLIGQYVGETPRLTKQYCKKAYGGILFIDEAYLIASKISNVSNNDRIKQECIGTLLQEMENNRDRLIVIFAGYTKEMDTFLHESNSGLGSRLYKIVEFEDYTDDELMEIFERMCKKDNFKITRKAKEKVRLKLTALRYSRDFGNARTVRNVYLEAKKEYRRSKNANSKVLEEQHILLDTKLRDYSTLKKELDEMIGLEMVKSEITRTIETCRFSKDSGIEIPLSKHMLFIGNAGTGKSTVAKLFCQMLFSIGAAKSPNCIAIAAGDLLGRYNAIESLQQVCRRASGGVLFIDEAYALGEDLVHGPSCISVLLDLMEEERDNITIILAGYSKEMTKFLDKNQGLRSRFPLTIRFENYSVAQLTEIFVSLCSKYGFTVSKGGMEKFRAVIIEEKAADDFGNARTVRNIFEQSFRLHAENYMKNPDQSKRYEFDENDIACLYIGNRRSYRIGFGD